MQLWGPPLAPSERWGCDLWARQVGRVGGEGKGRSVPGPGGYGTGLTSPSAGLLLADDPDSPTPSPQGGSASIQSAAVYPRVRRNRPHCGLATFPACSWLLLASQARSGWERCLLTPPHALSHAPCCSRVCLHRLALLGVRGPRRQVLHLVLPCSLLSLCPRLQHSPWLHMPPLPLTACPHRGTLSHRRGARSVHPPGLAVLCRVPTSRCWPRQTQDSPSPPHQLLEASVDPEGGPRASELLGADST